MLGSAAPKIGQVLSRVIVPAWVLTGALLKLSEASPRLLPKETILKAADKADIDLYVLLAVLIGLELLGVAVMLCIARLARAMAIFVLSVFVAILIGEMVQGNVSNCGCLGAVSPPPWAMLLIDGALLLGVVLLNPSPLYPTTQPRGPLVFAAVLAAGGFALSFATILPERKPPPEPPEAAATSAPGPASTSASTSASTDTCSKPVPSYWFKSDIEEWIGKHWTEVDLICFMPTKPSGLDGPVRIVVFYSRTCDHCEQMFITDLIDPQLSSIVTAVNVPEKNKRIADNAWPMPQTECELLDLPTGCDWIFTTPLTLRIEDGIVTCATEGDHLECMGL